MPRIASYTGAWILEGFELQTRGVESHRRAIAQQTRTIGAHEMHERFAQPHMTVQPETAIHRVHHAFAATREFAAALRK